MSRRVVVVGAGMAGLTAAVTLAEAGADVVLVEAGQQPGGRLDCAVTHTIEHRGQRATFPMEHGVHGIWSRYGNLRRLLDRLGLDDVLRDPGEQALIVRRPNGAPGFVPIGAVVRDSRLPSAMATMNLLPVREVLRAPGLFLPGLQRVFRPMNRLASFDPQKDVERFDHESVRGFIADFPPALQQMMRSMTHSGFFAEPDEVSLSAFLTGLWFYAVSEKTACGFDMLAEDGVTAIVRPLWERVSAMGGETRAGTAATAIEFAAGRPVGVRITGPDGPGRLAADAVVLAVDPPAMSKLATGHLGRMLEPYRLPRGVPSVAVRLWYADSPDPRRPFTGIFGAGAADNYFWLHRFMRPYVDWHAATGSGAVECHLYGARAAAALDQDDERVLSDVSTEVTWAWPEVGRRIGGHVLRNPATHVAFAPGVMSRLPPVQPGLPGLALAGDWIASPEPVLYLERACLTGLLAARSVAPALGIGASRLPPVATQPPPARSVALVRRGLRRARRVFGDRAGL